MARILVVDDSGDLLRSMKTLLSKEGYEVEVCKLAAEAIIRVRDNPPYDLIIVDYVMPGMDGRTFIKTLRETYPGRTSPFLVITGSDDAKNPPLPEVKHLLAKPFSDRELFETISDILEKGQTHGERKG